MNLFSNYKVIFDKIQIEHTSVWLILGVSEKKPRSF